MFVLSLVLWSLASALVISLGEYAYHRWPMHSRRFVVRCPVFRRLFTRHAVLHHGDYYPPRHFEESPDPAALFISVDIGPLENLVGAAWLWLPLLWFSTTGGCVLVTWLVLHGLVWTTIHREMHEPTWAWWTRVPLLDRWYWAIVCHHETHHDHPGTNFNIFLPPLGDWLLGTYRRPQ